MASRSKSELYSKLRALIPSTEKIGEMAAVLMQEENRLSAEKIREQFSSLCQDTEKLCYEIYLKAEAEHGETVISEFLRSHTGPVFPSLDRFILCLSQSRKQRAGKTFEAIIRGLFRRCGYPFSEQCVVDGKPDFILPHIAHYERVPTDCIVFTAKRTIRERWRQIATEGTRGKELFLATIDEAISANQLKEMLDNRIFLVVPSNLKNAIGYYSSAPNVLSFESFFEDHLNPAMDRWLRRKVVDEKGQYIVAPAERPTESMFNQFEAAATRPSPAG